MKQKTIVLASLLIFTIMSTNSQNKPKYKALTAEEEKVIVYKGTERPFSGQYNEHTESGTYNCKRCGAHLYKSDDKFDGHCGWPSFDDEIPGAIERKLDADGKRTEILCANCGAHLGHIFEGEKFTDKNIRHCVNSISLNFEAVKLPVENFDTTYFASGCFWGTQYHFQKQKGVISTEVGYMGGHRDNPTYEQVCTGQTAHAETVKVIFDANKISYEELTKIFFETHDQSQRNRQGPDIGTQYRSAIFYTSETEKETAKKLIAELQKNGFDVATELSPATTFWKAEDYHQNYYKNKGGTPYCHIYQKKF
ncbi:MAG: bifunctional methionine sulfoxide reductase B/A protein [Bacteroidales bacterium]|nr:bifunctional methionine sulfoxide reductase B/A protein [Bacteroidales bacterium]